MDQKRIPDALVEALSLDVTVLQGLLQQHRHSHRRAKYYHRLEMTVKCLQKSKILDLGKELESFRQQVNGMTQHRKRQRKIQEEQWERKSTTTTTTTQQSALEVLYKYFQKTIEHEIPELLSRIQHAADPCLTEIARGFFLPFMTVALAALARIRTLTRKVAKLVVMEVLHLHTDLQKLLLFVHDDSSSVGLWSTEVMNGLIETYMDPETNAGQQVPTTRLSKEQVRKATLRSLGWNQGHQQSNVDVSGDVTTDRSETPRADNVGGDDDKNEGVDDASDDGGDDISLATKGYPTPPNKELTNSTINLDESSVIDTDDHDVGETVDSTVRTSSREMEHAAKLVNATSSSDAIDKNLEMVQRKKEAKKKKRKEPSSSSDKSSSSKKKKKKKTKDKGTSNKSKGDFFDSLFD
jgi:hypothetical protein